MQIDPKKTAYAFRALGVCIWSGAIITRFQQSKAILIPSITLALIFVACFRIGFLGKSQLKERLHVDIEKRLLRGSYSFRDFFTDMAVSLGGSFVVFYVSLIPLPALLFFAVSFCLTFLCFLISATRKNRQE